MQPYDQVKNWSVSKWSSCTVCYWMYKFESVFGPIDFPTVCHKVIKSGSDLFWSLSCTVCKKNFKFEIFLDLNRCPAKSVQQCDWVRNCPTINQSSYTVFHTVTIFGIAQDQIGHHTQRFISFPVLLKCLIILWSPGVALWLPPCHHTTVWWSTYRVFESDWLFVNLYKSKTIVRKVFKFSV